MADVASENNQSNSQQSPYQKANEFLNSILIKAYQNGASDIHLKAGSPPKERIVGNLRSLEGYPVVTPEFVRNFISIMPSKAKDEFLGKGETDYAYSIPGLCRFRVNTYLQRGTPGFVFRVIPHLRFDLDSIGLPPVVKEIALNKRGLVLVTGVTGSGKSTTLAAIVDHINSNNNCGIITLEDPVEFLHNDKNAMVIQREVGADTTSFASGLRSALRQDPDIIMVGEMRDLETIETVLHAAETGHLVLSTMHTMDASETINRIIAVFPFHQQQQIRIQLSGVLKAVVSQRLIPTKDGNGRVPAVEVMVSTAAIRDCILEADKTDLIVDYIKQGRAVYKSQTFDQSLYDLVMQGKVLEDEAMKWVKQKDNFKLMLKGISGSEEWGSTTM